MNENIGDCALCLNSNAMLQNSHFIPQGIYKVLRSQNKSPHPVVVTRTKAIKSSRQSTAYLMCSECEDRLNRNGENWVLKNCLIRNGDSILNKKLINIQPDHIEESGLIYYASRHNDIISIRDISYFAMSMFWRGSIYAWNDDKTTPLNLGPYGEKIRKYLMRESDLPDNLTITVMLRRPTEISQLTFFPTCSNENGFRLFRFPMPGIVFMLCVGKKIPKLLSEWCFVRGYENPLFIPNNIDEILKSEVKDFIVKHKIKRN